MNWIAVFYLFAFLSVFSSGHEDIELGSSDLMLKSDSEVSAEVEARAGCVFGECDPDKGDCQCCGQHSYCGCFWDIKFLGGCMCRTGTRVSCWEKKDCPNRSSWTSKPFKPEDCNRGTWG